MQATTLVVLAAVAPAFQNLPPCTPEAPLSPQRTAIGRTFERPNGMPLTPDVVAAPNSFLEVGSRAWADRSPAALVRTVVRFGVCGSRVAVVGVVKSRTFLLSPQRSAIWGEYAFDVERVIRPDRIAEIVPGSSITVVREGGTVCTTAGQLQSKNVAGEPLEVGGRYLLFLVPKDGQQFATSLYDWRIENQITARRAGYDELAPDAVPYGELLSSVDAVGKCE
jgi:hypothetical protein